MTATHAGRRPPEPSGTDAFTADDFPADPALQCDIVMKGGITSGVVYPFAVCELATTFRLRSVGAPRPGRSRRPPLWPRSWAGARFWRVLSTPLPRTAPSAQDGPAAGPARGRVRTRTTGRRQRRPAPRLPRPGPVPALLTETQSDGRSLLFHLFRPQPQASRLFGLLSAVLEQKTALPAQPSRLQRLRAVLAVVGHATTKAPIRSLLGVLLGLALVVLGVVGLVRLPAAAGGVVTVALTLAVVVGLVATSWVWPSPC